jgi:hypothetical protein
MKEEMTRLRAISLNSDEIPVPHGFPKKLDRFLTKNLSLSGLFTFSTAGRAFPVCTRKSVVASVLSEHASNLTSICRVPSDILRSIENFVPRMIRESVSANSRLDSDPRKIKPVLCKKTSATACSESPRSKGGYYGFIKSEGDKKTEGQEDFLTALRAGRVQRPESTCHPLLRAVAKASYTEQDVVPLSELSDIHDYYYYFNSCSDFLGRAPGDLVHRVSVIPERGYKNRLVTSPPSGLLSVGELVRNMIFPYIKSHPGCEIIKEGELPVAWFKNRTGGKLVSADLTKATDGFSHEAIRAVGRGLAKAGFDPEVCSLFVDTLGAGEQKHLASYRVDDFLCAFKRESSKYGKQVSYLQSLGWDGQSKDLTIPMLRGSPMGTPCSFTLLCILNMWSLDHCRSGPKICGDDMLALMTESEFKEYDRRITSIGSGIHPVKTFKSSTAGVFCEKKFIRDIDEHIPGYTAFSQVILCPVKTLIHSEKGSCGRIDWPSELLHQLFTGEPHMSKDRSVVGIMTSTSIEREFMRVRREEIIPSELQPSNQPILASMRAKVSRILRTLRKEHMQIAIRKGRTPHLPACLGGLNYPRKNSKGVRGLSEKVRAQLYQFTHSDLSPTELAKFLGSLDCPPKPDSDSRDLLMISGSVADAEVEEKVRDDLTQDEGDCDYVDLSTIARFYGSVRTGFFKSMGGRWKSNVDSFSPVSASRIVWPKSKTGGSYSVKTPFSLVIQDLDNLIRAPKYRMQRSFVEKLLSVEHCESFLWHHFRGAGGWNDGVV